MGGMIPTMALSAVQMGLENAQQEKQAKAEREQMKAQAQSQSQQIQQTQDIQTRERRDQLRRALATQRARFAAQGLAGSASAEAALTGIQAEAEQEERDLASQSGAKLQNVQQDLDWRRRRNLLDASAPRYRAAFSLLQKGVRSVPLLDGE